MKNIVTFIATIFTVALLIWAIGWTVPRIVDIYKDKPIERVDTVIQRDTLYFEAKKTDSIPKIKYQTITQRDTIYLHDKDSDIMIPRLIAIKKKGYTDTLQIGNDTLSYTASITGRGYEDEDYPKLDSISFVLRDVQVKEKEVITVEKIIKQKQRKWAIGVQGGYGYGFNSKQIEPFVGIGVSYRIF